MSDSAKKYHILKAISSVTLLTIIAKIAGFIKQMVTASSFGTTIETDLISLAQSLISDFDFFITHALVTALVAVYINSRSHIDTDKKLLGDIFKVFVPFSVFFSVAFFIFSDVLAKVIAPSYGDDLINRLSSLIRIYSPIIVLQISIAVSTSILSSNKKFLWQQFVGFNQSIIIIVAILVFRNTVGPNILIYSFCLAAVFNVVFTGIPANKYCSFTISNPFKNNNVIAVLKMMLPLLVGYAMIYINQIVDKILSSGLPEGTVTALTYSTVLLNLVLTLITSTLSVLFVYITSRISKQDYVGASRLTISSCVLLFIVFLPVSILMCMCSEDIVSIVYKRGAFDASGVKMAAYALLGYGFSIVPYCVRELFARLLYGYKDSKHPMINSSIGIVVNIVVSVALCPLLGVFGITFGSSVSDMVCAVMNVISTKKKVGELDFKPLTHALPSICAGAVICIIVALCGHKYLDNIAALPRFIIIASIGLGGSYIVALPTVKALLRTLKKHTED